MVSKACKFAPGDGRFSTTGRLLRKIMQTKIFTNAPKQAPPWLEHYPPGQSSAIETPLAALPVTIGRSGETELPVDSTRVSREHAVIEQRGAHYFLRDLGSTNGTYVNGDKITEAELFDGDMLAVADVEFSFHRPQRSSETVTQNATQVMNFPQTEEPGRHASVDYIQGVRRMQESLSICGVRIEYTPFFDLREQTTAGYLANPAPQAMFDSWPQDEEYLRSLDCRVNGRLRELQRLVAVEESRESSWKGALLLPVDARETGDDSLTASLARLQAMSRRGCQLTAMIPDSAVCDIPYFRDFLTTLRSINVQVVYSDFAGGKAQIAGYHAVAPGIFHLAPAVTRDLEAGSQQHEQLFEIVDAAHSLGAAVLASGIETELQAGICSEAGCRFAQGPLYGTAVPLSELRHQA